MKILVTGYRGLLGPYLREAIVEAQHEDYICPGLDVTNPESIRELDTDIDAVIHAAALTDIEECENDPLKATKINRDGVFNLVSVLNRETKFVYISTDMVYDGYGPHNEQEGVQPANVYARTKAAGEVVASMRSNHLILRTNFFGASRTPGRKSFSDFVTESLTNGSTAMFFNDVWWSPLHMKTLSSLIVALTEQDVTGTYNLGSRDGMTKAQFAQAVAMHKNLNFNAAVGPSYFKVKRPKDMSLDVSKLELKGWYMPTLMEEIEKL